MKKILPLAKKSAKEVFLKLRGNGPYFCNSLNSEIFIGKEFFKHISLKPREDLELIERFLIIPFIEKIILNGETIETRKGDKKLGQICNFFKISIQDGNDIFSVIIIKKQSKYFLLSCFIDFKI